MNFHPNFDEKSKANTKHNVNPKIVSKISTTLNRNNKLQNRQIDKIGSTSQSPHLNMDDNRFGRDNRRFPRPPMNKNNRRPSGPPINRRPQNFPMNRNGMKFQNNSTVNKDEMKSQCLLQIKNERKNQHFKNKQFDHDIEPRKHYGEKRFPNQKNFEQNNKAFGRQRDFSPSMPGVNIRQNNNFDNNFQRNKTNRQPNKQRNSQNRFGTDHKNMNNVRGQTNFGENRSNLTQSKGHHNINRKFSNQGSNSKDNSSFNSFTNKFSKQNNSMDTKGPVPLMSLKFDDDKFAKANPNIQKHLFPNQNQTDQSKRQQNNIYQNNRPNCPNVEEYAKNDRQINQNKNDELESFAVKHGLEPRYDNRYYNNLPQQAEHYPYIDTNNSSRTNSSDNSGFGPKENLSVDQTLGLKPNFENSYHSCKNSDFEQKHNHGFLEQQKSSENFSNLSQGFNLVNSQNKNNILQQFNSSQRGIKRPGEPIESSLSKKPLILYDLNEEYHLKIHNLNLDTNEIYAGIIKQALMKIGKVKEMVSKDESEPFVYVKFVKDVCPTDILRAFYKGVIQIGNKEFTLTALGNTANIEKLKEYIDQKVHNERSLHSIPSNIHYTEQNSVKKQIRKIYTDLKDISSTNYGYNGSHLWMKPLPSNNQLVQKAVLDFFKVHGIVEKLYIRKNLHATDPNYAAFVRYQHESSIAKFILSKPQMMKFPPKFEDCQYGITCMYNRNLKTRERDCPFAYEQFTADSSVVIKHLPQQGPAIQSAILKMVEEYQAVPKVQFVADQEKNVYDAHINIPNVNIAEEFLITNTKFKFMKKFYQLRGSAEYRDFLDKGQFGVMENIETSSEEEEVEGEGCGVFDEVCPAPYPQAKFTGAYHIWIDDLIWERKNDIQPNLYNFMEGFGFIQPIATEKTSDEKYRAKVKFIEDNMADKLLNAGDQFKAVGKSFAIKPSRQYQIHIYNCIVNMRD